MRFKNINISSIQRNQRFRGPAPSAAQNAFQAEVIRDLSAFQNQHNSVLVPLTSRLPDGTVDSTIDAFRDGLDGRTLYVNSSAANNQALGRYYNNTKGRPNTLYEQVQNVYSYVDEVANAIRADITTSGTSGSGTGLTTQQQQNIGLSIFGTGTSSSTSLDGRTQSNTLNVLQLARDLYGSSPSFSGTGAAVLNNSVMAMVDALLELHSGNWDDDTSLGHSFSASSITTGTFDQERVAASSASGGENDAFVGTPSDLLEDLNKLRTLLRQFKGTAAYDTAISVDSSWTPVSSALRPTNFDLLTELIGSGVRSNSNPWGYTYTDIDDLDTVIESINDFAGRQSDVDASPLYSYTTTAFSNGDNLVTAIGALASGINYNESALSAHEVNQSNPHLTSDANLVVTDVTTNNVSTTAHGFAPKLSGSSVQFLDGQGNWTTPSGIAASYFQQPFTTASGITVSHNLGTYPVVQVLGSSNEVITVSGITHTSENQFDVSFVGTPTGTVLATVGSPQPNNYHEATGNYTTTATTYLVKATGAGSTITLHSAATNPSQKMVIKNYSGGNITVDTTGAETMDGQASLVLADLEALEVHSDGTNYLIT